MLVVSMLLKITRYLFSLLKSINCFLFAAQKAENSGPSLKSYSTLEKHWIYPTLISEVVDLTATTRIESVQEKERMKLILARTSRDPQLCIQKG